MIKHLSILIFLSFLHLRLTCCELTFDLFYLTNNDRNDDKIKNEIKLS